MREILADLGVEFIESKGSSDVVELFRTSSASAAVASSVNNGKSLVLSAEYMALLYSTVREQDVFEEFEELYFGMKDINNLMDRMEEEAICFGGIVSGFTSKGVAVRSLFTKGQERQCVVWCAVQGAER